MYQQCHLKRSIVTQIAYIPKKFAKVGMTLKIKYNGEWQNGWVVIRKYGVVDRPPNPRKAIREHKRNTGDSLSKHGL